MLKISRITIFISVAIILLAASCSQSENKTQAKPEPSAQVPPTQEPLERKLKVVVTNDIMADLIGFIARDRIEMVQLIEYGEDARLYILSESDISLMQEADMVFSIGPDFDLGMNHAIASLDSSVIVMNALDGFRKGELYPGPTRDRSNPFIWFSSGHWLRTVIRLNSRIRRYDSNNTVFFNANAGAYRDSIGSLDSWIAREISTIPFRERVVVTPNQGLEYMGNDYDIETIVLAEIIGDDELTGEVVDRLVAALKERRAKVIFDDGSIATSRMDAIIKACRQGGWPVKRGGKLLIDRLGEPGSAEATLFGTIRHNINTIVAGLK